MTILLWGAYNRCSAEVVELVDTLSSGGSGLWPVSVRIRPSAPLNITAPSGAGLDGVRQGVDLAANHFGPFEQDIDKMGQETRKQITQLPTSLPAALDALQDDHEFLLEGNVFSADLIQAWIDFKRDELAAVNLRPHPHEYVLYYDL